MRGHWEDFFEAYRKGENIKNSCAAAGISYEAYRHWTRIPEFKYLFEQVKGGHDVLVNKEKMDLATFRRLVLGRETFPHMAEWFEWFEDDENDHILILACPEVAKTTAILDYILYRIYLDQNIRIGYVSRAARHAIKQVKKVRTVLEQNGTLIGLCGAFAPESGDPHLWTAGAFIVRQRVWTPGEDEADATLAAYGSDQQITGSRFDLLIFDDPDDVSIGVADRDRMWNVILQAGETRLGTYGRMIVIGNRQDPDDVYKRILDQVEEEADLWKVYKQRAIILEPDEDGGPLTIWPEKFGLPRNVKPDVIKQEGPWDMRRAWEFFDRKRRRLQRRFFLVYQNDPELDAEKDFTKEMIQRAYSQSFTRGVVPPGSTVVCAMDPAPAGGAAVLVYAVLPPDRSGVRRRLVVDFEWGSNWREPGCQDRLSRYGFLYRPAVWVIDRQGGNLYFTQNQQTLDTIQAQGAYLYEIGTGVNKDHGDYRVTSLRGDLFSGERPLIILPTATPADLEMHSELRKQLLAYYAGTKQAHDGPMALWYAERAVRDLGLDDVTAQNQPERVQAWVAPHKGTWNGSAGTWGAARTRHDTLDYGKILQLREAMKHAR